MIDINIQREEDTAPSVTLQEEVAVLQGLYETKAQELQIKSEELEVLRILLAQKWEEYSEHNDAMCAEELYTIVKDLESMSSEERVEFYKEEGLDAFLVHNEKLVLSVLYPELDGKHEDTL